MQTSDSSPSAAGAPRARPLSPHLQVYRPQLTSVLSILHRITGVAMCVGLPLLTWWLLGVAGSEAAYARASGFIGSWFGLILLFGFSFALFYHLCNGVRHLIWDAGYGLDIENVYFSGKVTVATSVVLTALAWIVGLSIGA